VGTHLVRPGVVTQQGGDGVIFMGSDPDHPGFVPTSVLALFEKAGIPCNWFNDARPAIWEKYLFISAFGLVTAASGKSLGQVLLDAALMDEARRIMDEVAGIGAAEGVGLDPGAVSRALAKAEGFPPDTRTSYQRDVEAGRRDEGDLLGGTIVRLGKRHRIPTPYAERVFARVRGELA
jgi:2-dehydropantoate 2-reductase